MGSGDGGGGEGEFGALDEGGYGFSSAMDSLSDSFEGATFSADTSDPFEGGGGGSTGSSSGGEADWERKYRQAFGSSPPDDYAYPGEGIATYAGARYAQDNPDWAGYDMYSKYIPGGGSDGGDGGGGGTGGGGGGGSTGSSSWNIPTAPDIYSVPGLPGIPELPGIYDVPSQYEIPSQYKTPERYDVGSYDIPGLKSLMPYEGWYSDIDPDLRASVWEPYQEGSEKTARELAGVGMYGNQKAGMSGAAADVFKDYNIDASQEVAASLWDMTYPGMEKYFDASVQQGRDIWGAGVTSKQDYWKGQLGAVQDEWKGQLGSAQDYWGAQLGAAQDEYGTKVKGWGEQADREMTGWDALLGQATDEWKGNWRSYEDYLDKNKYPYDNLFSYLQESMESILTGSGSSVSYF